MPSRRAVLLLPLLAVAPVVSSGPQAQPAPPPGVEPVFAERGLAIRGTDPVAYFREGRAVTGRAQFTHAWRGATWRFASAANRDAFIAEPERYAPAYGGFCAFAVASGYSAPVDPQAWRIVDGRLFLNYNRAVQRDWEKDIPGHIAKGDVNWPQVAAGIGR